MAGKNSGRSWLLPKGIEEAKRQKKREAFYIKHRGQLLMVDYDCRCEICDSPGNEGRAVNMGKEYICDDCRSSKEAMLGHEIEGLRKEVDSLDSQIDELSSGLVIKYSAKRAAKAQIVELEEQIYELRGLKGV